MHNEPILRARVHQLLQSGRLPNRQPDRTWGGPGVGVLCMVCEAPVRRDQLEMEIQFAHDGHDRRLEKFHLHVRCFAVWELERIADDPASPLRAEDDDTDGH